MDVIYINDVEVLTADQDSHLMVIFNNLTGKNLQGQVWLDYLISAHRQNTQIVPGFVEFYRNDKRIATGQIPKTIIGAGPFKV